MARPSRVRALNDSMARQSGKLTVTCPERVRCADVGGANFSLPLNTLSCSAIFRSIAPRPLCCILRPPAPAADLCGIKLPHFVYPTEHRCEFGLRLRQLLAQFKQFFVCVLDSVVFIPTAIGRLRIIHLPTPAASQFWQLCAG